MNKLVLATFVALGLLASSATAQTVVGDPDAEAFRTAFLAGELTWDDVLEEARAEGQIVFGHFDQDRLNQWLESVVKPHMQELGIELVTRRVPNTRDVVDLALAEWRTGRGLGQGSIDTIWINGENFLTLATQGLLFGPFADAVPNSVNFHWDPSNPASGPNLFDFGISTERAEMPWSGSSFVCHFNGANVAREDLPRTHAELETWLRANPGRYTYIKPPSFHGNAVTSGILYEFNPDGTGHVPFQMSAQEMGADEFIRLTRDAFEYMRRIEPFLLGGGGADGARGAPIYPAGTDGMESHLVNGEIDISCRYGDYNTALRIEAGVFPEQVENFVFPEVGMIKNKNYIVVVGNAPNPAAAIVFANELASAELQLSKLIEIGNPLGVDTDLMDAAFNQAVEEGAPDLLGITYEDLANYTVPNTHATLVDIQEEVWIEYIERRSGSFEDIVRAAFARIE